MCLFLFFKMHQLTVELVSLCFNRVWLSLICSVHHLVAVFQMTIDAIFICFVEDCDMNDGITKPYFMSMGLMVCDAHLT